MPHVVAEPYGGFLSNPPPWSGLLKEKNCYNLFFVFFREDNFHRNLNFTVSLSAKALS